MLTSLDDNKVITEVKALGVEDFLIKKDLTVEAITRKVRERLYAQK